VEAVQLFTERLAHRRTQDAPKFISCTRKGSCKRTHTVRYSKRDGAIAVEAWSSMTRIEVSGRRTPGRAGYSRPSPHLSPMTLERRGGRKPRCLGVSIVTRHHRTRGRILKFSRCLHVANRVPNLMHVQQFVSLPEPVAHLSLFLRISSLCRRIAEHACPV